MKLVCGSSYFPKYNPEKPLGEDAHFVSHDAQTVGVADGVTSTIATLALYNSLDKDNISPFQMEAQKAGLEHAGGKIDDITVVVAHVVKSTTSID
ncbi:hypothetical protein GBA52_013714 [Prunus armeniaca]|nr:hypothetical protein GBA52_013714 [Prunus armeniaca]